MQTKYESRGVRVAGVTKATALDAEQFVTGNELNYGVFAEADPIFEAYGVKAVWGSVVYLIDRDNRIVARGLEDVTAALENAG